MFKVWDEAIKGCLQDIKDPKTGAITGQAATLSCVPAVFANLLTALLAFAGLTALIMFLVGGFKFMNSGGDPKKLEGAKNSIVFGILGLLIVLFSFFIIQLIAIVTGVPCITKFGFGC